MDFQSPNSRQSNTSLLLKNAVQLHSAGEYEQAEAIYRQILSVNPDCSDTLQFLGVLLYQRGNAGEGVGLIRRAVSMRPENPVYLCNLGPVLRSLGEFDEAEACYLAAVKLNPNMPEVWLNLGNLYASQKRFGDAEFWFKKLVDSNRNHQAALNNLAGVFRETARFTLARSLLADAIVRFPQNAEFRITLGGVELESGDLSASEQAFNDALRLSPDAEDAKVGLAAALLRQKKQADAERQLREVLDKNPIQAAALSNLGNIFFEQGRVSEAEKNYRQAIHVKPDYADAYGNLGHLLMKRGDLEQAEQITREAIRRKPNLAEAWLNLGAIRWEQGDPQQSLQCCDEALRIRPTYHDARKNRAILSLLLGKFEQGWADFESRFETEEFANTFPTGCAARWKGEPLQGRRILVVAEQGFGDVLQFLRFGLELKKRGAIVIAAVKGSIHSLLQRSPCVDEVVSLDGALPAHDYCAAIMSLPFLLGKWSFLSDRIPYLVPDHELVTHWHEQLQHYSELRIGIAWQGRKSYTYDRYRSIPLSYFQKLAEIPGVRLFALQKGFGREQIDPLRDRVPIVDLGETLDEGTGAFVETAAVMMNLDLVVSSDTALVHLAGALGRPVWVPIGPVPDWRWHLEGEQSPWYPTMRLFRESQRGDWSDSIGRIANEIRNLVSKRTLRDD